MRAVCKICPHRCSLAPGQTGLCRARRNIDGRVTAINYGKITALALDPIEKKPLRRFYPGSLILSAGSFGCNLNCPFCQNHSISMSGEEGAWSCLSPEELAGRAADLTDRGNIGLAFTYNEPLVGYEYVRDCAPLIRDRGLKNVLVTNGFVLPEPLEALLPHIDAMNIDLKCFSPGYYREIRGELQPVLDTIKASAARCHVEVTTLIIPGVNDTAAEIKALASWLAGVRRDIPLHLTQFVPRHRYSDKTPTPAKTVSRLADVAREHLDYVYAGNG